MDASSAKLQLIVDAQACKDQSCLPVEESLTAKFTGTYEAPKSGGEFRDKDSVVAWSARFEPPSFQPGDDAKLIVTAAVADETKGDRA